MSLTIANVMATSTLTLAANTPQQILCPVGIDCAEVWISSTADFKIAEESAKAAAGFPLLMSTVYRLPLHVSNVGGVAVRQPLWITSTATPTVSIMFLGTSAEVTQFQ